MNKKILPRTQFGNPILRAKAKTVPAAFLKTTVFKSLVKDMFRTMRHDHGVGLAAPQIGLPIRLAVIQAPGTKEKKGLRRVIINPKIIAHSKNIQLDWEGCLSFPDGRGQVPRWASIKIKYMDEKGKQIVETHRGYVARIFQHETDHLYGTVYVDRMTDMKTLMTHKEFIKRIVG